MRPFNQFLASLIIVLFTITSCDYIEDPGPIQYNEEVYIVSDFNRLDIGDAMHVTVVKGVFFEVNAKGDRRNLDDLEVSKVGNTLITRFTRNGNRRHTTYITISMPELVAANFTVLPQPLLVDLMLMNFLSIYLGLLMHKLTLRQSSPRQICPELLTSLYQVLQKK